MNAVQALRQEMASLHFMELIVELREYEVGTHEFRGTFFKSVREFLSLKDENTEISIAIDIQIWAIKRTETMKRVLRVVPPELVYLAIEGYFGDLLKISQKEHKIIDIYDEIKRLRVEKS